MSYAIVDGRWVLTHQPSKPAAPKPVDHYFHAQHGKLTATPLGEPC